MIEAVRRAVHITRFPNVDMQLVADEPPDQRRILARFVLPLACIPAVSWCLGLLLSGEDALEGILQIVHRGVVVYVGSLLSIYLLTASLYLLAPLFSRRRTWGKSFQVAAYSSAPVMLSGVLLVLPMLSFATLLAVCHSFYLQYVGVNRVLGVKEGEAAEYVALVAVLLVVSSTLLGALASWVGIV